MQSNIYLGSETLPIKMSKSSENVDQQHIYYIWIHIYRVSLFLSLFKLLCLNLIYLLSKPKLGLEFDSFTK